MEMRILYMIDILNSACQYYEDYKKHLSGTEKIAWERAKELKDYIVSGGEMRIEIRKKD